MKTFVKAIPGRGVGGLTARIAMTRLNDYAEPVRRSPCARVFS